MTWRRNFHTWLAAARFVAVMGCALLWVGTGLAASTPEDVARALERRIKAALLYRFINYVEWPDSAFATPGAPFTIAITGAEAVAAELSEFAVGRTVLNRPLAVRRLRGVESVRDVHIVFVGRDEAAQLGAILRAAPQNALVVTEWDNALQQGSVINFVIVDAQVRFEISLETAQRRNIRLSSRLLSVAHSVRP
jgi:hypothetical protein